VSLDVPLLRNSFDLIIARQPELTPRFYEILFERYPQVRPLFGRNSGQSQARMLQDALVAVMDKLEDASWLEQTLGAMGAKHVDYNVSDEMYDWVGNSLIATIAETAANDWTPELEKAWTTAYGAISGLMLAGARAARDQAR